MSRQSERDGAAAVESSVLERCFRAANYLSAAQIYLKANALLREPIRPEHIKDRLLGHWGTCPGINLVEHQLNRLILREDASILLVTGPGHGAPACLANMYLEGSLGEFYPELTLDAPGLERFVKAFSRPDGFPSHLNPALPGVIHEGGELGYSLSTSFGSVLDNPGLITACIVGDGEAETGPMAASWNGTKFLNPSTDGAVLPIVHLNGFKIASPTILATMSDEEIEKLFFGYGWAPRIIAPNSPTDTALEAAFDWAYEEIRRIQKAGRIPARWPMLVLKTPKGWTGPKQVDGLPVEGSFRSHQVPLKDAKTNPKHLEQLEAWLRSYRPEELFDENGAPAEDIRAAFPNGDKRISMNPHAFGWKERKPLNLPGLSGFAIDVTGRGDRFASSMETLGAYLAQVVRENAAQRNFRIVCPDELESNKLGAVLEATVRQYDRPAPGADRVGSDGRVLETLSEHNCQGWLQGYLLTGRHGLFPCYEAFLPIVDGMVNQYAKFLKTSLETPWRGPVSSLNYVLTSEAWRQDHNGYSHQDPGFINNALTKKGHTYRVYFPPDANSVLAVMERCLEVTNQINLVVAGKQPMPQWLTLAEAREHLRVGASIWNWASRNEGEDPEVVLACCSDNMTIETLAASDLLLREAPDWRVRVVNVVDLLALGIPQKYPHGMDEERFQRLFPLKTPVVFNFHGYTSAIKQVLWERPDTYRFDVNGYSEEGTTTTPFDMHIRNRTSRYHLVIQTARYIARVRPSAAARAEQLVRRYEEKLREHREFIDREGVDPPEIADWRWGASRP
jgi:xylulose-5-phosphate/fructose-6-phosphate phosphoketolase